MSNWCVLLAAGRGTRSGLSENKVFFKLNGRSILSRCIDTFALSGLYDGLVLVLAEREIEDYLMLTEIEGANTIVKSVVAGGDTRGESAYNGLQALPKDTTIVSIHDAARPFVTREIMQQTILSAVRYGSGIISTPVTDTIKKIEPGTGVVSSLDRNTLRAVQTPQTFRYDMIMKAYEDAARDRISVTDDAALFERSYGSVTLCEASDAVKNKKMTTPEDFRTERTMNRMRIGSGYDAHRLKEGRDLILCGVNVPYTRGLDGHSDADVAIHALMDAILGAMGEGDIGHRFPDSDPQFKGISSMLLLEDVVRFAHEKGYVIVNADVTIVAQKPKLAPYITQMRENIGKVMGCGYARANVKATTTEHMGFEGEEIGISAQAVALLETNI